MALTKDEARQIADTLNGALGRVLMQLSGGAAPAKRCDHKDLGSGVCAKCGDVMPKLDLAAAAATGVPDAAQFEKLYARIKSRFIEDAKTDPILLELIAVRPEIVVGIEHRVVSIDGSTLRGRVARLMAAGWFEKARSTNAVRVELARTGADPGGGGSLKGHLDQFVADGFLTRDGDGYLLAPGVKVSERELTAK